MMPCAHERTEALLAALGTGDGVVPAGDVALVFAHPDDETIACGGQLYRLADAHVVIVTNGAPRDLVDAKRHGFDSAERYAAAREAELLAAMDVACVDRDRVHRLGIADQQAAHDMEGLATQFAELFTRYGIRAVITHAYEGGHPDHDAVAFAVHAAASRSTHIGVVEAPLYRLGPNGEFERGTFALEPGGPAARVALLSPRQLRVKQQMRDAYVTQAGVLAGFSLERERFRVAPGYDFTRLPNAGRVLYEHHPWGLDGDAWLALARSASASLHRAVPA